MFQRALIVCLQSLFIFFFAYIFVLIGLADILNDDFSQLSQGTIDFLYCAVVGFSSLSNENKESFVATMLELASAAIKQVNTNELSQENKEIVKIVLYFFQQLCLYAENSLSTSVTTKTVGEEMPKSTKSKKKSAVQSGSSWESSRRACVEVFSSMVAMEASSLWKMGIVPEGFSTSLWKFPLLLLEGSCSSRAGLSGSGAAEQTLREKSVALLQQTIVRVLLAKKHCSDSIAPVISALIDAVTRYEAMATHVTKLVAQSGSFFSTEFLREVGRVNMADLSRTGPAGVKNLGQLIINIAEVSPEVSVLNILLVVHQLNSEVYQIRYVVAALPLSVCICGDEGAGAR